jgi:signal-transduction protein with cAMP-binding, CBS, and nucleotidyltransferase domain
MMTMRGFAGCRSTGGCLWASSVSATCAAEPSPAALSIWELNYLLSTLTIGIMTASPYTITPEATLAEAARMMLEHRVSGLPVVDDEHHVIGIITESDIFTMVVLHEWHAEPHTHE